MSREKVLQRVTETLEEQFLLLDSLEAATYLFGYTNSEDDSYTLEGLAKKEGSEVWVKHRSADSFVRLADLINDKPALVRRMRAWEWYPQHIFTTTSNPESTPAGYCWCGFHEDQHTVACANEDEAKQNAYEKMYAVERKLHLFGVCSNPNGCGLPSG